MMHRKLERVFAEAPVVTITEGGNERQARAYIQPLSVTSPEKGYRATPMGIEDDRRYLLIAEIGALESGDDTSVSCGGRVYELLRCERLGNGSHWEGILRLKAGGEDVQ